MPVASEILAGNLSSQLLLISDSFLQPGFLLLREILHQSTLRNDPIILILFEQPAQNLVSGSSTNLIDCCSWKGNINVTKKQDLPAIHAAVLEAIVSCSKKSNIQIVIDSLDTLAEHGTHVAYNFVRNIMLAIRDLPGSRLTTVLHESTKYEEESNLLNTLLSPATASSVLHLTLYPAYLFEMFSRVYGLTIPTTPNKPLDIRVHSFLKSFTVRSFGDPFIRPESTKDEDERQSINPLADREGKCIVEWSSRGVILPADEAKRSDPKRTIARGFEGLRRTRSGVEAIRFDQALDLESLKSISITPTVTKSATNEPLLPFNLNLTESQRQAKDKVVLPYLKAGEINYVPDEGDDMDDDDPDEDLEI